MHKSGFVNIIGNPNVGKSTLMNALVGEKLSIITSKAQTTRHRIMGIVNGEDFQIVYSDTPGILKPAYKLQESMMNFVQGAVDDADVILYVTDTVEQSDRSQNIIERINNSGMCILKGLSIIFVVHHTLVASVVFSGSFEVDRVADIFLPFKNFADGIMIPMVRISVTKLAKQGVEISGRR